MKRSEQKLNDTWDLSSLCIDKNDFNTRYEGLLKDLPTLGSFNKTLSLSSDNLYTALEFIKNFLKEAECISSYAFLCFETDAGNSENAELAGKASILQAKISEALSYLEPEILSIDKAKLEEALAEPRFEEYRIFISKIIRFAPHTLSEKEERLLSLNSEAAEAPSRAFHDLVDVDMDFGTVNGIKLTQSSYMSLIRNTDETFQEINEKEMMVKVMCELQSVTDLPLQIDTTSPEVMEAALRRYNGKPMVNSVNGKKEIMESIFPLVKKYGGFVVALTLDEDGIPDNSEKRIEIAKKIYETAEKYGLQKKDIIIDPLAMAVSSDSAAGIATLETVNAISNMDGFTSLGISNVSFGLPNREFVTSAFFTMALTKGLTAAIMNPLQTEMIKAYKCFCLLKGMDENCAEYIDWASKIEVMPLGGGSLPLAPAGSSSATPSSGVTQTSNSTPQRPDDDPLKNAIIHGLKTDAANATIELLKTTDSLEIINDHLIPGLDFVGKRFEQKTMYLPQLLMAAEAAKSAFAEIRTYMEKSGKKGESKGKIIIATVKGDIHDIGKNIVKVLLENYDFDVIDLGKDVPPETVVDACKKDHIELVGLSALMTTTVAAMEETIKQLRKECPWAKVCVGGAVMTQEYADQIGADFYGKDAMDTVRYACQLFQK